MNRQIKHFLKEGIELDIETPYTSDRTWRGVIRDGTGVQREIFPILTGATVLETVRIGKGPIVDIYRDGTRVTGRTIEALVGERLTRISHTLPTAAADAPAGTPFLAAAAPRDTHSTRRVVGPSGPSRRQATAWATTCCKHASAPSGSKHHADRRLRALATEVREKYGLGLTRSQSEAIHLLAPTSVEIGSLPRLGYPRLSSRYYMANDQLP